MGQKVIYSCIECGNYFRSSDDKVVFFEECWCINCNWAKGIKTLGNTAIMEGYKFSKPSVDKCDACGAELRNILVAQCPQCQSKRVELKGIIGSL